MMLSWFEHATSFITWMPCCKYIPRLHRVKQLTWLEQWGVRSKRLTNAEESQHENTVVGRHVRSKLEINPKWRLSTSFSLQLVEQRGCHAFSAYLACVCSTTYKQNRTYCLIKKFKLMPWNIHATTREYLIMATFAQFLETILFWGWKIARRSAGDNPVLFCFR